MRGKSRAGQQLAEFAISYAFLFLPLSMMIIFTAQLLWVWHSAVEYTRAGARYASTHCYQAGGTNVITYMRANVPPMPDRDLFRDGSAELEVTYYQRDSTTGELGEFTCPGSDCSRDCVPDMVRVRIVNYQFRGLQSYFGLPPVSLPNFQTSLPVESIGCSTADGEVVCQP